MNHIAIIYHDADFDGKLSNEVCRHWLKKLYPDAEIHSYGWDYGRKIPVPEGIWNYNGVEMPGDMPSVSFKWDAYDAIYIVDLSVDELMAQPELRDKIVWVDHHKTAIDKWVKQGDKKYDWQFRGYRIDGVAACRLCWQWFANPGDDLGILPSKQEFIDRKVSEPELIRLAGEYDIWDHRDPDGKALQFGLRTLNYEGWRLLIDAQFTNNRYTDVYIGAVICDGRKIKEYCDKQNDEYSAVYSQTLNWEGYTFCCLNIGQRGNSDLLRGGLKPEHQACFAWRYTGNHALVSLYHAPGHEDLDLSTIAKKYGGGGHRGACGFRLTLKQLAELLP